MISTRAIFRGVSLFAILWLLALVIAKTGPPSATTSLRKYEASRDAFPPQLADHFPELQPHAAADAVFTYFPGYMQGGAHLQLRIKASDDLVRKLDAELQKKAASTSIGGGSFEPEANAKDKYIPMPPLRTKRKDEKESDFPSHFTLYLLHASHYPGGWNHGKTKGVAVSRQSSEVIYWAENW